MPRHILRDARGCFIRADANEPKPSKRLRDARGRFMCEAKPHPDAVKPDYYNLDMRTDVVAAKHKMSLSTLHRMQVENGWEPRAPRRIDPNDLLMRLFEVLETQIKDMETNMRE